MKPLTPRQQQVFDLIKSKIDETGMPPTRAEIARELGFRSAKESHYQVDPNMFRPHADFLLRVHGESMKDIGILDGDLLAVHKTQDVRNGQVVVARVEDDVTVKRLERRGSKVLLHAENEEFSPIEVDLTCQNLSIEGIAVGIIRNTDWM